MRAFVEHVETCDECLDLMDDPRLTEEQVGEMQYQHFKETYSIRFNVADLIDRSVE